LYYPAFSDTQPTPTTFFGGRLIMTTPTPKAPWRWFIILWLGGFMSCLLLAKMVKLILPAIPPKAHYENMRSQEKG